MAATALQFSITWHRKSDVTFLEYGTRNPHSFRFSVVAMLRNYAHHAQPPKSSVHSVHKMHGKEIWQILKSFRIDYLLWNHDSSLTFVSGTLTDHFSVENDQCSLHDRMITMVSADQLCARRKPIGGPIGPIGTRIGRIGPICAPDCAWTCTCADRPSQFLYMHMRTHAQNGFPDDPQINCMHVISWTFFH
jgi:hypothetical protein